MDVLIRAAALVALLSGCSSDRTAAPDVSDPFPAPTSRALRPRAIVVDDGGAVAAVLYLGEVAP